MSDATLIDTCVLLDVLGEDPVWRTWSEQALADAADSGPVVINPIIYAEVSVRYARLEDLDAALPPQDFTREALPYPAAFLAGKAFALYRRSGGSKRAPLPDFYIGAHASVAGHSLVTRDQSRYRTYFPKLKLIHP
ncbi:type II toxin-antitoxin system VapC family toxin [Streptomyces sp. N2-109]|uniref:Type II toxin-antitoxin system VapC family toxin n=1 Tax=Streptomyces gossypii TaxID=2883101 RepID=A0ABT2JXL6_9ACTN|nr:type II toxin-antitoxin system VapC family toxin [Streptomyces gossypii]MCT2592642.1 type II toxin-antitoxin system VapC family toxin [Streptomyces gossypii]